jgi:hypothetical protein
VGDSAVRLLVNPGVRSAWVKSCRNDCLTAKVLLEVKAAALHPERYRSLLSDLSTKREGEAGKEAQAIGLACQTDRQKSDGQTSRNKVDERWYLSRPCSVLNSGLGYCVDD